MRLRLFVTSSAFILALLVSIGLLIPHAASAEAPDLLPGVDIIGEDGIVSNAADSALASINKAIADSTKAITKATMDLVISGSDPKFTGRDSGWFIDQYGTMMTLSFTIMLLFAVIAFTGALLRGDTGAITVTLANIFLAVFLTFTAVAIVQYALWSTDAFSDVLVKTWDSDMDKFVDNVMASYGGTGDGVIAQVMLGIVLGLVMTIAALALLVVMLVRGTLIYLTVLFLPFLFACLIWPAWRSMLMAGIRFLTAMILSKFVIVAILSASAAALAGATAGADKASQGLFTAVFGIAAFVFSALSPIALLNWLPGFSQAASGAASGAKAVGGFAKGMAGSAMGGAAGGAAAGGVGSTPVSAPGGAGNSTPGAGGGVGTPGGSGGPGNSPSGGSGSGAASSSGSPDASSGGSGPSSGGSSGPSAPPTPPPSFGGPTGGSPVPSSGAGGASAAGGSGASMAGGYSSGSNATSPHLVGAAAGGSSPASGGTQGPHEIAARSGGSGGSGGKSKSAASTGAQPPSTPKRGMREPRVPIRLDKTSSEIGSV